MFGKIGVLNLINNDDNSKLGTVPNSAQLITNLSNEISDLFVNILNNIYIVKKIS